MADAIEAAAPKKVPRVLGFGDLILACVMSSLLCIGVCLFVTDQLVAHREVTLRASIPTLVTVDEKQLLKGFLTAPENADKTDEEFEQAMQGWARKFQMLSDDLAAKNNLIVLRRSNVAAGAKDITDAIGRALYGG